MILVLMLTLVSAVGVGAAYFITSTDKIKGIRRDSKEIMKDPEIQEMLKNGH